MAKISKRYIDGPNGQIHLRVAGNPANEPVLLLHQTPSSGVMFEALMHEMADDYFLIAPDLPGFGLSDEATEESVESYAETLWLTLSARFGKAIHIVGHHTGTSIAVEIAANAPNYVASLALSGPALLSEEMKAALPSKAAPFDYDPEGAHLVQMWERIRGKDEGVPLELTQREVRLAIELGDRYLSAYEAVIRYPIEDKLQKLECPCLVFAGTNDILFGAVDPTLALLKNGSRAEIEGAGGYLFDQNPVEVARLLDGFFRQL